MNDLLIFALTVFTGFFAIMNPIANMPIFISMVGDCDEKTQKEVAFKSTAVAFIITTIFVLLGKFIFELFGITIPAFKITGGLLIFYVGFEMLQSKKSTVKHIKETSFDESIAISPLAIPILSGPGTIVTAMNFISPSNIYHIVIVIVIFFIMCVLTYYCFILSEKLTKIIGNNIISVVGKIMGLIIAIIGMDMLISGIKLAFNL